MYALIIGRAYPDKKTGMMGIFEFEQSVALNNSACRTVYSFCDTRSIKRLRRYGYTRTSNGDVPVYGYHLPIGGIPKKLFNKVKKWYCEKLLKEIIKEQGVPDIIHVHFPLLTLNKEIWDLLKGLKIPIVVTEHWTKVQIKEIQPYQTNLLKKIVNEANEFICVGDQLRKSVIELTATTKNIRVIPNMVSSIFFYDKQKQRNDRFEFITVGRLVEVKRFELVINAFTKAFEDNKSVHLIIVGGGPLFNKLKRQIDNLGMNDRIMMLGFLSREETASIIRRSDVFVSASILETFGVPFIEAMACGKPIVGMKNGPIDKYVNKDSGVLFTQDDLKSLTNALKTVYDKRKEYDEKQISDKTIEFFSEKSIAEQLKNTYKYCVKN